MNTSHRYSIWWSVQSFSNSETVITNSGGGSLYCNENGQTVRQVKERRRHPNGKLQLEWASNRPPPSPNSGSQIQHLRICPALPKFWICDHEFSGGGSFTTFHFYRWIQVTDTAFDDLFRASQILKLWSRIQGGGPYTVMKMGKQ